MQSIRTKLTLLLVVAAHVLVAVHSDCADHTISNPLIPSQLPTREWCRYTSPGYDGQVSGMIFDQSFQPECGLAIGGINTGCLDFEVSGTIGFDTLFEGYPRKLQRFAPFLGLCIGEESWVLASPEIVEGGVKQGAHDPARDPYTGPRKWKVAVPAIEKSKPAKSIRYAARFPIVDYDFETDAPVDVDARIWSPFIPGDLSVSSIPAIIFEVHLHNRSAVSRSGALVFNYPGKQVPTEINSRWADANDKGDMIWSRGKKPLESADLHFVRPNPPFGTGGRLSFGDPSRDGRAELLLAGRDAQSGEGILLSAQRIANAWPGRMDGSGSYEFTTVDTLEGDGFTIVEAGDVDGDGFDEIVAGTISGRIHLYRYTAETPQKSAKYTREVLNSMQTDEKPVSEIRLADLNGDGRKEIFYAVARKSESSASGVYRIDQNGVPTALVSDSKRDYLALTVGDFDSDGKLELVVGSKSPDSDANKVEMLKFTEDGQLLTCSTALSLPPNGGPQWIATGDFNGNGRDDLLIGTNEHGTLWTEFENGEWPEPEVASGQDFAAYSVPAMSYPDDLKTQIAVGGQNSVFLGRLDGADVATGKGKWGMERFSLGPHQGPNDASMPAVGLADLSGDGVMDIVTFFSGHELFGVTIERSEFFSTESAQGILQRESADNKCQVVKFANGQEYAVALLDRNDARFGGNLLRDPNGWSKIANSLPAPDKDDSGISTAVDFSLKPGEKRTVRFALAWYAPTWGSTYKYTRPNVVRFRNSKVIVDRMQNDHVSDLARIQQWQQVVYDEKLPIWLHDALINSLSLIPEDSYWAAPQFPLGDWCFPDGLFGMIESPRAAPQIECIPCTWYGNIPILYFFPDLMRTTLRGFEEYQRAEDGAMAFNFGPRDEMWWNGDHALENQIALNGFCFIDLVHRQWLYTGDQSIVEDFYPAVKGATEFAMAARPSKYGMLHMPTFGSATEWWEGWAWEGMTTHAGSLNLAGLQMTKRMAEVAGDKAFAAKCDQWYVDGARQLETAMWSDNSYLLFRNPKTGRVAEDIMSNQFDAEWVCRYHGIPSVFQHDRLTLGLETIRGSCLVDTGAAAFATKDGRPMMRAYGNFIPEMMILGMTYAYEGDSKTGLEICKNMFDNIYVDNPYAFDWPNWIYMDSGKRAYGSDYYQNMVVWALPAALTGQTLSEVGQRGSFVDRILKAGKLRARLRLNSGPMVTGNHQQVVPNYVPPTIGEVKEYGSGVKPAD